MTDRNKISHVSEVSVKWWEEMIAPNPDRRGHRAARARLRRATTMLDIIQVPEALQLISRLSNECGSRVAIVAGVLAYVDHNHQDKPVACSLGRKSLDNEKDVIMSEARFRRLLRSEEDDLLDSMRRLVRLAKGEVNVGDLSYSILNWGDSVKKYWIFKYYLGSSAGKQA